MAEPQQKKFTIDDRFHYPETAKIEQLPKDELGLYQEDETLCGAKSPGDYHWACSAGYSHNPPHVATSGSFIVAVWEDGV